MGRGEEKYRKKHERTRLLIAAHSNPNRFLRFKVERKKSIAHICEWAIGVLPLIERSISKDIYETLDGLKMCILFMLVRRQYTEISADLKNKDLINDHFLQPWKDATYTTTAQDWMLGIATLKVLLGCSQKSAKLSLLLLSRVQENSFFYSFLRPLFAVTSY